ncbi:hypothetical protein [Micromonospora sp. CNB394]|uniref:hypothetical protein n=1 Tax=Micromonospora sp. CNB394 TaxID=1169151 RepID=UPI0012DC39AD|nr:hypothetical protein [Micromonospora sp. CNB394]
MTPVTDQSAARRKPVEHRPPTPATIKQLYGTAFRCGEPSCTKPLYRLNNETGEWILNSRVAHIHARSEGGPRWDPQMSEESNRSPDNLIPLCEEHAFEIDATPEHFPAELLLEWKRAQLEEHLQLGKSWPLSDAEAAEVAVESFDYHSIGRATAGAHIVLSVARQVGLLIETGRLERRVPERAAQAWRELREQVNRSMPVFDAHGERLVVEPSIVETEPRRVALEEALAQAVVRLEPIAAQAVAELHAVIAAEQRLAPWCSWVERAIREVLTAAGHWPGRPPLEDDDVWPNSLAELSRASQALMARWRGEKAPEPPAPTPPETPPAETAEQGAVRQHEELLERARPWARVDHRAYDADLCRELMDAAAGVVLLPDIPSLLATGLDATARLAARVARNSDDRTFDELIDQAAARQPLAVAVTLLRNMMFVARDAGRPELESKAAARAGEILAVQTWREVDVWTANRTHARTLLAWTAAITSDEAVRTKLASAVEQHPEILPSALLAMAQWIEERDVRAFSHVVGIHFQIEDLPAWFATEAFATAIRRSLPNVNAADEDDSARYSDDVDRLASQVLWLADNATENCGG